MRRKKRAGGGGFAVSGISNNDVVAFLAGEKSDFLRFSKLTINTKIVHNSRPQQDFDILIHTVTSYSHHNILVAAVTGESRG